MYDSTVGLETEASNAAQSGFRTRLQAESNTIVFTAMWNHYLRGRYLTVFQIVVHVNGIIIENDVDGHQPL
jgi:hypothetical protein